MSTHSVKVTLMLTFFVVFGLFALNNITDFDFNFAYVQHVLSMETTFHPESQRAIHSGLIQLLAYLAIIGWQLSVFLFGMLGVYRYAKTGRMHLINLAMMMGVSLYFFGFLGVASGWFMMWQSKVWSGQATALNFSILFFLDLVAVNVLDG